jgi:hypothetical protein
MTERGKTTLMRKYVQEQVDEKLNYYLLEVWIWKESFIK